MAKIHVEFLIRMLNLMLYDFFFTTTTTKKEDKIYYRTMVKLLY